MTSLLYIIILISEILYYSLFIKFAKNNGKLWKYILVFILETLIIFIFNSTNIVTYLIFAISSLLLIKYIVKIKVSIFDMLIIFIMLLIKFIIELPFYIIFNQLVGIYITGVIYGVIKILLLLLIHHKLHLIYCVSKKLWDKNNFYIRYIFSTFMFIYTIISCIFIILYYL